MEKLKFRRPTAEDVEARIGTINQNGLSLLMYQRSRTAMSMLDETVGPERWQREHQVVNGNLFCRIGIYFDGIGWVWKEDVGTESNQDKEKGQASDSFKRAAVNWGICRELYSAPFIWIPADLCRIQTGRNGKPACNDAFDVTAIGFTDEGKINRLEIKNKSTGKIVFKIDLRAQKEPEPAKAPERKPPMGEEVINAERRRKAIDDRQKAYIYELCGMIGQDVGKVLTSYKVANINGLTWEQADEIIGILNDYRKKAGK